MVVFAQERGVWSRDDTSTYLPAKPPVNLLKTVSIEVGLNMTMRGFNRFVLDDEYAKINLGSMRRNMKTLPVWDSNKFSTNLIAHPYHGSMYFSNARTNGYDFYQSIPFAFGGSLMWEYLMETKPPSINDLVATTFGGISLGEITFRLSDLVLDNRSGGVERVARELLGGILSPTRLINRITTKELWRKDYRKGNRMPLSPFSLDLYFSNKSIVYDSWNKKLRALALGVEVAYGELDEESIRKPYDWFYVKGEFNIINGSAYLTQVNGVGAVFHKKIFAGNRISLSGGLFQYFNYYNLNDTTISSIRTPYYISEAASFGPGFLLGNNGKHTSAELRVFTGAVLLGASISDYFKIDDRDYNMGNGASVKLYGNLNFKQKVRMSAFSENYLIYTWKGVDEKLELKDLTIPEIDFLNVQGDRSLAKLHVFGISLQYEIMGKLSLLVENRNFYRKTSYKHYPDVRYKSNEIMLGLQYGI